MGPRTDQRHQRGGGGQVQGGGQGGSSGSRQAQTKREEKKGTEGPAGSPEPPPGNSRALFGHGRRPGDQRVLQP
eukprot:16438437-Heterocapsa_arctica.AAC.2